MRCFQPRFNNIVCSLSDADFKSAVFFLAMDIVLEFCIGGATTVALHRGGIAPFTLLRSLIATHLRCFVAMSSTILVYFMALQHSHMGVDLSFQFPWLKHPQPAWTCG